MGSSSQKRTVCGCRARCRAIWARLSFVDPVQVMDASVGAGLGERGVGLGEDVEDAAGCGLRAAGCGLRLRRVVLRCLLAQPQGGARGVVGEFDLEVVEAGGVAMLDGHEDLAVSPAQVQITVPHRSRRSLASLLFMPPSPLAASWRWR